MGFFFALNSGMKFLPIGISKIKRPSDWKLQQETLIVCDRDLEERTGDKNPYWRGGVSKDMKAYQKKYREDNDMAKYQRDRRARFRERGLRWDGTPYQGGPWASRKLQNDK